MDLHVRPVMERGVSHFTSFHPDDDHIYNLSFLNLTMIGDTMLLQSQTGSPFWECFACVSYSGSISLVPMQAWE